MYKNNNVLSEYSKNGLSVYIIGWFNEGKTNTYLKARVHTSTKVRIDDIKGDMLTYLLIAADKRCKTNYEKVYLHYAELYYDLIV